MRSTLHTLILAPVVLAAAALATTTASAETVKVPFDFTVANQNWPAGTYHIVPRASGNMVTLASEDGKKMFTCNMGPGEFDPSDRHVLLRFDEVGANHVLEAVQYKSMITPKLDKKIIETTYVPTRLSQGR